MRERERSTFQTEKERTFCDPQTNNTVIESVSLVSRTTREIPKRRGGARVLMSFDLFCFPPSYHILSYFILFQLILFYFLCTAMPF